MSDFNLVNLLLLVLLVGVICTLGAVLWRGKKRGEKTKQEIQSIQDQLKASFSLSGYLLDAHDEAAVVLVAMRSGHELIGAGGCAFVPFSEWEKTLPVLQHGNLRFIHEPAWQTRLSEPATRHICRNCSKKESGAGCVLLQGPVDAENVYCVSLRCSGRVIGVISYFFTEPPEITEDQQLFLSELVRVTDLTLDAFRMRSRELSSRPYLQESAVLEKELAALTVESQNLLHQLEYQAVLNERTRLAREIHDGLAQTLAFLKMETVRMQMHISKGEVASINQTLQACHQTLSDAYLDARQAIDNLRRAPDESLTDWLEMTTSDFSTLTGLSIDISNVKLAHVFPNRIKAQLCRIAQEALTNIRKHAQASMVTISALQHGDEVILEITDDGCGFTPVDVRSASMYGLRSMRERAESISADFQIVSAPETGTTIRLHIPTSEKINS
ncbi:MAG: sensor histidine kinase [Anaerolineae bacterium]|jgi:signal transduction histidine kinase|nr:sensor histidine kinase [Anaerolineae bacterium]MBT7192167.1 sensor histidine kinase [Anaerolineae bacterium]MBT7989512.1 sensor histidine kinase [Anaerolineae bacterium]